MYPIALAASFDSVVDDDANEKTGFDVDDDDVTKGTGDMMMLQMKMYSKMMMKMMLVAKNQDHRQENHPTADARRWDSVVAAN